MKSIHDPKYEIELYNQYQQILDSYRQKINQPEDQIGLLTYESADSEVFMYVFDQESYQKFKDHVSLIPDHQPVLLYYHYGATPQKTTYKVLVVKSSVNNKVHEVPVLEDWYQVNSMIQQVIPKYFFPNEFVYEAGDKRLAFSYYQSWEVFFKFATHPDNQHQRYFEVTAGKASIKDQILMCRKDYVELVLPLMEEHQLLQLDQTLADDQKLEKLVELTKKMADLRSSCERHEVIEAELRKHLNLHKNHSSDLEWKKLYDLQQTFIREVDEGDWNGNGTYWNEELVKYYNTDSAEMIPILKHELLRTE
jgi:hypothetical protein